MCSLCDYETIYETIYILFLFYKSVFVQTAISVNSVHSGEFDTLVDDGNEATYLVDTIMTHNHYRPETYANDIALVKVTRPIKFTRFILPACIPEQEFAEKVNL